MGYFSNGTEGDMYTEQWCGRCVHDLPDHGCPAMLAHWLWNYDECNKPDSILHKMIPREGCHNGRCFAFSQRQEVQRGEA